MRHHFKYLWYVLRHKWFVFLACWKYKAPLWAAIVHDWTKFLPSEWFAYAKFFYTDHNDKEVHKAFSKYGLVEAAPWGFFTKDRFTVAWLHHQNRNPHHWQYWIITKDTGETFPVEMPERYWREMLADWAGAGRAITGRWDPAPWYLKNRDKIKLHNDTRAAVEKALGITEDMIEEPHWNATEALV